MWCNLAFLTEHGFVPQVKFTSAVKLSEGAAVGAEYTRDEEENFFKRLGKWRSGRRNPSKLHHTEEKDGRPPPPQGAPHPPMPHCLLSVYFLSLPHFFFLSMWRLVSPHKSWADLFFQACCVPFSMSAPPLAACYIAILNVLFSTHHCLDCTIIL